MRRSAKASKAFDNHRAANLLIAHKVVREAFMRAARLTPPTNRVFLTKKGDHFEKIPRRAPDWYKQREKLLRLQEESLAHIHKLVSLAAEEKPEFSTHPGDAATDTFDRDLTLSLVSFEQEKLYEIEAALKRIDDGSYGVCELTGQPIPRKRLDAIAQKILNTEQSAVSRRPGSRRD